MTYFENIESDASGNTTGLRGEGVSTPREMTHCKVRVASKPNQERSFRPGKSWLPSIDAHSSSKMNAASLGEVPEKPKPAIPAVIPILRMPTVPLRAMGSTEEQK